MVQGFIIDLIKWARWGSNGLYVYWSRGRARRLLIKNMVCWWSFYGVKELWGLGG